MTEKLNELIKEIRGHLSHWEEEIGAMETYDDDTAEGHANNLLCSVLPYLDEKEGETKEEQLEFEIGYERKAKKDKIRPKCWTNDYHEGYIDGLRRAREIVLEEIS